MEINNISKLAEIMRENGLTLMEISEGETAIKLERGSCVAQAPAGQALPQGIAPSFMPKADNARVIKSPTVGVFYSSASPDTAAYVNMGSVVKTGDVLCLIEAMKLMNEITADCDGEIVEIMAGNGQVVEFGQPLFRVK